ncbi:putative bifunctional diguanylate cyclase/phosphodiesterase [Acinetobacter lactucae]|uniref:putative bifunctional diguanylate cyclase/phosphodiesterase n=1 Tax=Acinetobacter lactucae TaxID=1785128 RepID=UPI00237B73EF|nr:EAL domain-containing protein [Acinetobacter lactucae]MDD9317384.1 EAL domain-containing protein [Acinetobacter lactucae]
MTSMSNNTQKHFIVEQIPLPTWVSDENGLILYCNVECTEYWLDTFSPLPQQWLDFIYPADLHEVKNRWLEAIRQQKRIEFKCRLLQVRNQYRWCKLSIQASKYRGSSQINEWYVSFLDIDHDIQEQQNLQKNIEIQNQMLDISVDCIKVLNVDGTVSHMNKSGCLALGIPVDETEFGMKWLELLPPHIRKRGRIALKKALQGKVARFAGMSCLPDQDPEYWDNMLTPIHRENGEIGQILCVSRNVTQQHLTENQLRNMSERDELTGLCNRRSFKFQLKRTLAYSKDTQTSVGLLLIDLDHFKHINDTLGHSAGDHLLKVLSKRFSHCVDAERCFVARLGGDEFAVIINNLSSENDVRELAAILLQQLNQPITYLGNVLNGGMSIGCAIYPQDAEDQSGLLSCADMALHDLKARGRGGIRMYDPCMMQMTETVASQLNLARQLIRHHTIQPYYQPKVDLRTHHVVGFEALLRWHTTSAQRGYPAQIAEAFKDYNLASKIGETMQHQVLRDIAKWINLGINPLPVSLNAAPVEFLRDNYAERLLKKINQFQIPTHYIEIEVTEHMLGDRGSEYVIRALNKLKQHGVRIALDDFGTGFSSLTHIRDYPIDSLKVDCSFIQKMQHDPSIYAIVQAIGLLAPNLSLGLIAEGIETPEQEELLRQFGYSIGQGFLFESAIDSNQVISILKQNRPYLESHYNGLR